MPANTPPTNAPTDASLRIDVLTLFPEMFPNVLGASILKRAASAVPDPADPARVRPPVAAYHVHNIRDWSTDTKHKRVDAPPYGGGPGMVMQCQPVWDATQAVTAEHPTPPRRVFVTPKGKPLTQAVAADLAQAPGLILLCGHYEGIDQRALDALRDDTAGGGLDEISLGDFVLSGGELPALVLIDAVVRLLPGALGHADSARDDSFADGAQGLLDHPHYTRPPCWQQRDVPPVLQSGDHAAIDAWRADAAHQLTTERRPDLLGLAGSGTANNTTSIVTLRDAGDADHDAVCAVHHAAFPTDAEATLVGALLDGPDAPLSIVAEQHGRVVGHALLSIMTHQDEPGCRGLLAVGPVAVHPDHQRRGIGTALVREAIRQARDVRAGRLFVLGEPGFYGPLGFTPAIAEGFASAYDHAGDAFQTLDLGPRRPITPGRVAWADAFGNA